MARTTNADLDQVAKNLNRRLEGHRATARVTWERRYDYVALDETDEAGQVRRMLTAGTARQVYDAMWHMIRGLDLLHEDRP